jgi:hypothetical protein
MRSNLLAASDTAHVMRGAMRVEKKGNDEAVLIKRLLNAFAQIPVRQNRVALVELAENLASEKTAVARL